MCFKGAKLPRIGREILGSARQMGAKPMRYVYLFVLLATGVIMLAALFPSNTSLASIESAVQPTGTAEASRERLYRSYPAPTGYPGFRRYYQKRCYPGCHTYGASATTESAKETPTRAVSELSHDRPYRSYPAPTGFAGFRRYYQKRCYPGCHTYGVTPVATVVHP